MADIKRTKIFVYVDERGQHVSAEYFVVVAIVTTQELGILRSQLKELENRTGVGKKKWKKTRSDNRLDFLRKTIRQKIGKGDVFFGAYKKPLPFFLPMLKLLSVG